MFPGSFQNMSLLKLKMIKNAMMVRARWRRHVYFGVNESSKMLEMKSQARKSAAISLILTTVLTAMSPSKSDAWSGVVRQPVARMGCETPTSPTTAMSRRTTLSSMLALVTSSTAATSTLPTKAYARNLPESTGASGTKVGTVDALIPILQLRETLQQARNISLQSDSKTTTISRLLLTVPRDERTFKRLFDEFSDAISYKQRFLDQNAFLVYYTKGFDGPNRPGIEAEDLNVKQTKQFGARNDAWVAWSDLQAELEYASRHPDDETDAIELVQRLSEAVDVYVDLAPRDDVTQALQQVGVPS